ncbi:MAG: DUF4288 domain-containing protein [Terriglobia bacterium]
MKTSVKDWYAARCLFRHGALTANIRRKHVYEERIILLRASSDREAIKLAEEEARKYASHDPSSAYLNYVETYHLFEASIRSGAEVFSLLRSSNLSATAFLSRYYDDGSEHRRKRPSGGRRAKG